MDPVTVVLMTWAWMALLAIPLAKRRNRDVAIWFVICVLTGFVGLSFLLCLPNVPQKA